MMDGRIGAIRQTLEQNGLSIPISWRIQQNMPQASMALSVMQWVQQVI